jgi:hypothetical protein
MTLPSLFLAHDAPDGPRSISPARAFDNGIVAAIGTGALTKVAA